MRLARAGFFWSFLLLAGQAVAAPKLFLISDSTVANYTSGYYPQTGWGQVLQHFFDANKITVDNRAIGGTSSKSFYDNNWTAVKANIKAGDFVMIGFGINDRNKDDAARYAPDGVFQTYIKSFVNETKALGAHPIIVSTIVRDSWTAEGLVYDAWHEHPVISRNLAAELKLPLIDLDKYSKNLLQSLGQTFADHFLYLVLDAGEYSNYASGRSDTVHIQEAGAVEMARLVVEALETQSSFSNLQPLLAGVKPRYPLTVTPSVKNAGLVTQSRSYPAGVPLTLKARTSSGHSFTAWIDAASKQLSNKVLYQTTMPASPLSVAAVFDGSYPSTVPTAPDPNTPPANLVGVTLQEQMQGFCGVDGIFEQTHAGYTGAGYANADNATGKGINWRIYAATAGAYKVWWRFANGATDVRPASVQVNGVTQVQALNFTGTGAWTTYNYSAPQTLNLTAGLNSIRLTSLAEVGLANIDNLIMQGVSLEAGYCDGDMSSSSVASSSSTASSSVASSLSVVSSSVAVATSSSTAMSSSSVAIASSVSSATASSAQTTGSSSSAASVISLGSMSWLQGLTLLLLLVLRPGVGQWRILKGARS